MTQRSVIDSLRAAGRELNKARERLGEPAAGSTDALVQHRIDDLMVRLDAAIDTWQTEAERSRAPRQRKVSPGLTAAPPVRCATCARRLPPDATACPCGGEPEKWAQP